MKAIDFIVIGIICVWIVLAILFIIKQRKNGGCIGCGKDCFKRNVNTHPCNGKCSKCKVCKDEKPLKKNLCKDDNDTTKQE